MGPSKSLPSLLRIVLAELEQAYEKEGAGRYGMPSLDQWSNLLRVLDGALVDVRELPTLLRLSKRAVRTRISTAVRHGWVEEAKEDAAQVRLTVRGTEVAARWRVLQGEGERRWRTRLGEERAASLRAALEELVTVLPLEHPHYPASYGPADASITGGNGQDWKAVPRIGKDPVSPLPLSALVSQALVAFAMAYEKRSPVALTLSATVLRRIPPEGRPVKGLGNAVGLSALARHGFVRVSGEKGSETVWLTPKGLAVASAYEDHVAAVEADWESEYGAERVATLRRALAEVLPASGG